LLDKQLSVEKEKKNDVEGFYLVMQFLDLDELLVNFMFTVFSDNLVFSADEADGEVIDTSTEGTNTLSINGKSSSKHVPEASSSESIESDHVDIEVQSPMVETTG